MNAKERIKAAMDLKPVDRVPFMCQMSIGHMLVQLGCSPLEFWLDKDVYKNGLIELRNQYEFDGILVSLYGHDPDWRDKVSSINKTDEFEICEFINGDKLYCPFNDLPYYEFAKMRVNTSLENIESKDLPKTLDYFPVSKNLPFHIDVNNPFTVLEELVMTEGSNYSIHGEITSPFDYYLDLTGYQEGLFELLLNPEKAKMVIEHFTDLIVDLSIKMCKTGVDAIKISSPFAGSNFISPDHYMEFVFPFEKQIVQAIRANGIHTYIHTCGTINDRLEMMLETGASGIECLDPAPLGDVSLEDAKRRIGAKGFIKGNIDSVNTLLNGTQEEIYNDVKRRIEIGKQNNGFILSTACSIAPDVKKENIKLMREIIGRIN